MSAILDGKLIDPKVTLKISSTIERGPLLTVNAIVVHQTGAATATSSLESYKGDANGAHFLIDKDGTIYQTARVNQMTYHVGRIKSRCLETHTCAKEETKAINALLHAPNLSYQARIGNLSDYEKTKTYPDRYPSNGDSIGIELVGETEATGSYVTPTAAQTAALKYLVEVLQKELKLTSTEVFRHPEVSYKEPSEAKDATW